MSKIRNFSYYPFLIVQCFLNYLVSWLCLVIFSQETDLFNSAKTNVLI